MNKVNFLDDYSEGCHPKIIEALLESNMTTQAAYGDDEYSNFVEPSDGKLTVDAIENVIKDHGHYPHMVKPRLVYISNATEIGTIYTRKELVELSKTCKLHDLLLFMDGARLGAALTAEENDLELKKISELVDIFWIGGTKVGALLGEAIVIPNKKLSEDFAFHIKQRGGLLAKGRVLGLQFLTLFSNDLFFDLARSSNQMAEKLSKKIVAHGYELEAATQSNQVFAIFPIKLIEKLETRFNFYVWQSRNNQTAVVRLITSWATQEADVDAFIQILKEPY